MSEIFTTEAEPFTLPEIARAVGVKYEVARGVVRRLREKPETFEKVKPLGNSRYAEYSADAANFIARRCCQNERRSNAAQTPLAG